MAFNKKKTSKAASIVAKKRKKVPHNLGRDENKPNKKRGKLEKKSFPLKREDKPDQHKKTERQKNQDSDNGLPNTFKFAAETLKIMSERGGSAGSIVVSKYKNYNYKLIFALVMNTIKNIKIIKKIIHNLKLSNQILGDNTFLLEILLGDLLYGRQLRTVENCPTAASIIGRKDAIVKEQNVLRADYSNHDEQSEPKYLRVNHLKCDVAHVISQLKISGLKQLEYSKDKIKFKKFINKFKSMQDDEFMVDFHFPNDLIIVKQGAISKVRKSELLKKNKVVSQDKASFMAVEALSVEPSQKIIDACFAPGGKTSLIASKMKNKGKIIAYDLNKARLVTALRLLKLHGVTCSQPQVHDFTQVKLRRLPKIHKIEWFDSILIDPSCSGSGIKGRVDYKKTADEAGRLKKLQAFQVSLLRHALKACVSKTIVYCTCSSSIEENEQVIQMALEESGAKSDWNVVEILPYWPTRGDSSFEFGSMCLRSDSNNLTNGFFIAKLEYNKEIKFDLSDAKETTANTDLYSPTPNGDDTDDQEYMDEEVESLDEDVDEESES